MAVPAPWGSAVWSANTHGKVGRVDSRGWQRGFGVRGAVGRLQGFCPFLHLHPAFIGLNVSSENPGSRGLFPRWEGYVRGGLLQTTHFWPGNRNLCPRPLS